MCVHRWWSACNRRNCLAKAWTAWKLTIRNLIKQFDWRIDAITQLDRQCQSTLTFIVSPEHRKLSAEGERQQQKGETERTRQRKRFRAASIDGPSVAEITWWVRSFNFHLPCRLLTNPNLRHNWKGGEELPGDPEISFAQLRGEINPTVNKINSRRSLGISGDWDTSTVPSHFTSLW